MADTINFTHVLEQFQKLLAKLKLEGLYIVPAIHNGYLCLWLKNRTTEKDEAVICYLETVPIIDEKYLTKMDPPLSAYRHKNEVNEISFEELRKQLSRIFDYPLFYESTEHEIPEEFTRERKKARFILGSAVLDLQRYVNSEAVQEILFH